MKERIIKHLEGIGYTFITTDIHKSTQKILRFFGFDGKGTLLEFKYDISDGYLMGRIVGTKYWDIEGKLVL